MSANLSRKRAEHLDRGKVKAAYEALRPACETALQELYQSIRLLLERQGYTPTIKYRLKSFDAYYHKLQRNHRRDGKESAAITDLLGLRIICPFLEDLDRVEQALTERFEVVETVRKGADRSFQEFGYDSVHLVIRLPAELPETPPPGARWVCEIQLRTILQDAWAEVEHELIYKSDISLPNDSIKRKLASLNATLTLSDLIFQEIRDFQREVRKKGERRRQVMGQELLDLPPISIASPLPPPDAGASVQALLPMPLVGGSPLEKAMFEALQAHSNHDLEAAVGLYSRILRMKLADPIRSLVYNHRGMAHFALASYREALQDFSQAVAWDRNNVRGFNNRGLTLRVLKKHDRALEDYNRSLDIDPAQPDAYWGRAQTCYEMKLLSRALADCEKVLELKSDHRPASDLLNCIRREIF